MIQSFDSVEQRRTDEKFESLITRQYTMSKSHSKMVVEIKGLDGSVLDRKVYE